MRTVLEREHVSAKTENTPQHINQAGDLYCLWQAFWIALCQAPGTDNGHYLAQVSSKAAISGCLVTQLTTTCLPLSILAGRLATNTPPVLTPSHRSQQVTQKKQNQTPASALPHLKNKELLEARFVLSNVQKGRMIKICSAWSNTDVNLREKQKASVLHFPVCGSTSKAHRVCRGRQLRRDVPPSSAPLSVALWQKHTLQSDSLSVPPGSRFGA